MGKPFAKKVVFGLVITGFLVTPGIVDIVSAQDTSSGASLFISPQNGSAIVGNVIDVSIYVDTSNYDINAVDVNLRFPADKLQVVSPSVGKSIVGIWTNTPSFNNLTGEIRFQGGIPTPGINTSRGLISTVSFRVRSVGHANINFSGDSKILLNDGLGTNILTNTSGASISLTLPSPAGPNVTSFTHPDQSQWYRNSTVGLEWTNPFSAEGYSYSLSEDPIEDPDNVSEGSSKEVSYKNLSDGLYYFHIKALRNGVWGGTTHYAIKIDSTPPAKFPISIPTGERSPNRKPVIDFTTTDAVSGINRYELKIVPVSVVDLGKFSEKNEEGFFLEVPSRYIPSSELSLGDYNVIVRAYDNAGNFRESTKKISVVTPLVTFTQSGVIILEKYTIPWITIIIGFLLLITLILAALRMAMRSHKEARLAQTSGILQDPIIKQRLEELEKRRARHIDLRKKHARMSALAILFCLSLLGTPVKAQETTTIPPPIIGSVSDNISDNELFYVSGRSDVANSEVIIYIQNLQDNQLLTGKVSTDKKGDWFYAHNSALSKGNYFVWTQQKIGNQLSPPSPQKRVSVSNTAIQIGASRLSYETMYLFSAIILLIITMLLSLYTAYHFFEGRRKRKNIKREVKELDNSIRDGFIRLQEDIKDELEIVNEAKLNKRLTKAHEEKELELKKDLKEIQEYIHKEFQDVKRSTRYLKY